MFSLLLCLAFVLLDFLILEAQGQCRNLRFAIDPIHGRRLNNHVIRTTEIINEDICQLQCYLEPNCVSYNFNKKEEANGKHKCDLNNATYEHDNEHSGDLAKNENYVYHGAENACAKKPCQNNATCQAGFTDRDYQCLCNPGFTGHDCRNDVNECTKGTHSCDVNAVCNNTRGSYKCTCKDGFYGDGINCTVGFIIDQCTNGTHNCDVTGNAVCNNTRGYYNCTCKDGFHGDGIYCTACNEPLGMESRFISDAQISASSQYNGHQAAVQGRLHYKASGIKQGGWSALVNNRGQWLQVDLGAEISVGGIATQGRNQNFEQWVTAYKLEYSNDEISFLYYKDPGSNADKIFTANTDKETVVYHSLSLPIKIRYIRVVPWTWQTHISMRMEVYGCPECRAPLGMESHAISDAQISASSEWDATHAAIQGRLNFQAGNGLEGAWSAKHNDQNQWLQVDLGSIKNITHLATQGRNAHDQWVKSYKVEYSNNSTSFRCYQEYGTDKIFDGNSDRDTIVYNVVSSPIIARYIRIVPRTYFAHISMRMEIYGC